MSIPLLADFHPKGEVARSYGVYIEEHGMARRALVMIGPDGTVTWSYVSPTPLEIPGANLIFDALDQPARRLSPGRTTTSAGRGPWWSSTPTSSARTAPGPT